MRQFPLFHAIAGRRCLVLGSGAVAERKAEALRRAGAVVEIAPRFDAALLDHCAIAIGADAAEDDVQALAVACRARGLPVNVVDRPDLSTAIMPAVIDRDPVTIAIGTAGTAPVLARLVRQKIEALLPPALGAMAALLERGRDALRARLPEMGARRRFIEAQLEGPAAARALAGDAEGADRAFAAALATADTAPRGMVWFVGAGPGAADLLTLRALRLLGEADVIMHDKVLPQEVLDMARRDAERVPIDRQRSAEGEDSRTVLLRLARAGRRVVRLRVGDPLVFTRSEEEMAALVEAGIPFELVPGITAATAIASTAGIPVTQRGFARGLTLVTAFLRNGELDLDLPALARPGQTLAIYMGAASLAQLRDGLAAHGFDTATPAALVESGARPGQRVLQGSFAEVVAQAPSWLGKGPALLLVGPAVAQRGVLASPA